MKTDTEKAILGIKITMFAMKQGFNLKDFMEVIDCLAKTNELYRSRYSE